ncbi:hypothetical protein CONLIGDRAFT_681395 [Coniochaeta ligniaria NRRL 30616]|uniref:Uncharacterized protein n=1 Tax=Coniochaeta ligniaria NRRL 30616 TaxID=1408157 RepID=A0A1J7IM27_9PEZI|nr:hypothetical protein CONLIGDRAFT_681395 [Coniochaeta ligniaria NRRL 30616]
MEVSPLIKAHDHAKAALDAARSSDSTVAVNEHALAAGEFSNAAKNTGSIEALRTLRLLEQHHQKLSELLKFPLEQTSQQSTESDATEGDEKHPSTGDDAQEKDKKQPASSTDRSASPVATKPLPTLSHQQRRYPARDLTSSIASNLATARGIRTGRRGQVLTPSVSNDSAPGSLEVHPRRDGTSQKANTRPDQTGKPSWVPPSPVAPTKEESQQAIAPPQEDERSSSPSDEGFSRFYNTFGSIFNKLSAPLAFAGLPLITEEPSSESAPAPAPEPPSQRRHRSRPPHSATIEPDLSKIYSKATLRALRGDGNGPNDSFYVVPTSGHTASYASILTFDQKERRRVAASVHGGHAETLDDPDEEDFVDARESQVPLSPALRKRLGKDKSDRNLHNVVEELHLENASLKEMLDKLSKRLHAFEINSQSSHLALAQSLRLQRPGSPMSSSGGGGSKVEPAGDEALKRRNRELEEQLALAAQRMEILEQDHAKLQQTLDKYRDRWEKLKAGAKARREGQGSATKDGETSRTTK